jgi:hypothetical protein
MTARVEALDSQILALMIPSDPPIAALRLWNIRAGVGAKRLRFFAAELMRMYSRYAENRGWKVESMESSAANPEESRGFDFDYGNGRVQNPQVRKRRASRPTRSRNRSVGRVHTPPRRSQCCRKPKK